MEHTYRTCLQYLEQVHHFQGSNRKSRGQPYYPRKRCSCCVKLQPGPTVALSATTCKPFLKNWIWRQLHSPIDYIHIYKRKIIATIICFWVNWFLIAMFHEHITNLYVTGIRPGWEWLILKPIVCLLNLLHIHSTCYIKCCIDKFYSCDTFNAMMTV